MFCNCLVEICTSNHNHKLPSACWFNSFPTSLPHTDWNEGALSHVRHLLQHHHNTTRCSLHPRNHTHRLTMSFLPFRGSSATCQGTYRSEVSQNNTIWLLSFFPRSPFSPPYCMRVFPGDMLAADGKSQGCSTCGDVREKGQSNQNRSE